MIEDLLNRKMYANQIVEEISNKYGEEKEKFKKDEKYKRENTVFAISGKWGEGKTGILKLMEKPLIDKGFKIVWFSPWKYSQEGISLNRAFLKTVKNELNIKYDLKNIYSDTTKTLIDYKKIKQILEIFLYKYKDIFTVYGIIIFAYILFIDVPYFNLGSAKWLMELFLFLLSLIEKYPLIFSVFLIPLFVSAITSIRKTAAVTTAEEFEEIFNSLLGKKIKIVIFIDDLDRCNEETIKKILDSLKTFFLHPECSYVITGDHTVIEKYAAKENDKDKPNIEEGRRFLKKLFDVYWRVPLPTPYSLKIFITSEVEKSKIKFLNSGQNNFINYLVNDDYFERNLRQIKRFITKLRFNLESLRLQISEITNQQKTADEKENDFLKKSKETLQDILNNPDLLAKVLLIEEKFYKLYEHLVHHPEEYIKLEKILRKKTISVEEEKFIEDTKRYLDQKDYFLYETLVKNVPKFTNEENTVIHNAPAYFLFSGSTGLPSNIGPDETNFTEYIKNGLLVEKLSKSFEILPTERNNFFANKAIEIYDSIPIDDEVKKVEKMNILNESLKMCMKLNEWSEKLKLWQERLFKLPIDNVKETYKMFFESLLYKDPDLLIDINNERPESLPLIWEIILMSDLNNWHKNTQDTLYKLVNTYIKPPASQNLKYVDIFIQKTKNRKIESELSQHLIDPDTCKLYLDQLKTLNLLEKGLALTIKSQLLKNIENIKYLDWIINNKAYLKEINLFTSIQNELVKLYKSSENLLVLITNRVALELDDKLKIELEKEVIDRINLKKDFKLLEDSNIQSFVNNSNKIIIYGNILNLITSKENFEKRKNYCKLLLKNNPFWNGLEDQTLINHLKSVQNKNKGLKKINKEFLDIINSWSPAQQEQEKP